MNSAVTSVPTETITFKAPDGFVIKGTYVAPKSLRAPALLLLHQLGRDASSYAPIYHVLREAGFALLAIDFRGHGESLMQGDKEVSWEVFSEKDWQGILLDTQAALEILPKQRGVDASRIGIIGASIGANAALIIASSNKLPVTVLLSPGLNYRGIDIESIAASAKGVASLIVAAEEDSYSHESSQKLSELMPDSELISLKGETHGVDMFKTDPELIANIINHLSKSLKP